MKDWFGEDRLIINGLDVKGTMMPFRLHIDTLDIRHATLRILQTEPKFIVIRYGHVIDASDYKIEELELMTRLPYASEEPFGLNRRAVQHEWTVPRQPRRPMVRSVQCQLSAIHRYIFVLAFLF